MTSMLALVPTLPLNRLAQPITIYLVPTDKTCVRAVLAAKTASLKKRALALGLDLHDGTQHCADGLVEHRLQPLLRQGRALQVFHGADLLRHRQTLEGKTHSKVQTGYVKRAITVRIASDNTFCQQVASVGKRRLKCEIIIRI